MLATSRADAGGRLRHLYGGRARARTLNAPETGYTTQDRADDVACFVKAMGLQMPAIMGHSMGGSTAGAAAATYPDLFSKVVLEDPAWFAEGTRRQAMNEEERAAQQGAARAHHRAEEDEQRALIAMCREQSPSWPEAELDAWAESKQQLSPNVVGSWETKPRPWQEIATAIKAPTLLVTANTEKAQSSHPRSPQPPAPSIRRSRLSYSARPGTTSVAKRSADTCMPCGPSCWHTSRTRVFHRPTLRGMPCPRTSR